jgi:hypothetical protein
VPIEPVHAALADREPTLAVHHDVAPGETVETVARLYQLPPNQLRVWNSISEGQNLAGRSDVVLYLTPSRLQSQDKPAAWAAAGMTDSEGTDGQGIQRPFGLPLSVFGSFVVSADPETSH